MAENHKNPLNSASNLPRTTRRRFSYSEKLRIVEAADRCTKPGELGLLLRYIIFAGFFLRLFVAIWNSFFGPSFGADLDALSFHLEAVEYARNLTVLLRDDRLAIYWLSSILYCMACVGTDLGKLFAYSFD